MTDRSATGRNARHPSNFTLRSWMRILHRVWLGIGEHNLSIIAAGVAFFSTLAIFPAIAALIALYGLVADPAQVEQILVSAEPVLPPDVYAMIDDQVGQLVSAGRTSLGLASLVSIFLALWSARAGVTALMQGLNIVYREKDSRSIVMQYLLSLMLTFLLILMAIVAVLCVIAVPAILNFIELGPLGALLTRIAPTLILGLAVVFVIGTLYRYAPHRATARKRWISTGAVVATIAWVAVSMGLSVYVSNFANLNQTYGSLGAIVALLLWLYGSAFVVLLGAVINAEMELQTGRDTTTGRPRPMGEREAWVADHVAD